MRKNLSLFWDFVFYFLVPIFCWEIGRRYLSDYIAMIISSLPGIIYSIERLRQTGKLSFTAFYLLINIMIELSIDLLSGSALQLLWNTAIYSLVLCLVSLISCIVNKPLFLYFSLDILVQQDYDRKITKQEFTNPAAIKILKALTLINGIRELIFALLLMHLIKKFGVEIYTFSILIDRLLSIIISALSLIGFVYLYKLLNDIITVKNRRERKLGLMSMNWCYFHFEQSFFYFSNNG